MTNLHTIKQNLHSSRTRCNSGKLLILICILYILISPVYTNALSISDKDNVMVILPKKPTEMELFLAKDFSKLLELRTGAKITISLKPEKINIFLKRNKRFKEQEYAYRLDNNNIIIEGKNEFGLVNGAYTFLENVAGFRWYTAYGDKKIPAKSPLTVKNLNHHAIPSFKYRNIRSNHFAHPASLLFCFRNRLNTGIIFSRKNKFWKDKNHAIKSCYEYDGSSCHNLFSYITSKSTKNNWGFKWKDTVDYFAEHPNFYSMNKKGERVNTMQLCFSNKQLRKILLQRISERLKSTPELKSISLSAEDFSKKFCYCPKCRALEKKYKCPGGPFFDFLLEACNYLKKHHPGKDIYTLAYRKEQTEIPPVLKQKMPDNFMVIFAPIDDDISKPISHKNNSGTYENLKKWHKLCQNIWIWNYPVWYCGENAPFVALHRYGPEMKALAIAGVNGGYYQNGVGFYYGLNFNEMLAWIFTKLQFNCNEDVWALAKEFCQQYYGPASSGVLSFIRELSDYAQNEKRFMPWDSGNYYQRFWTPQRIAKYNKKFIKWEKITAQSPSCLARLKELRVGIDTMLLKNFRKMKEKGLINNGVTPELILRRAKANLETGLNHRYPDRNHPLRKWVAKRKNHDRLLSRSYNLAVFEPKPLPPEFASIPTHRIVQAFPLNIWGSKVTPMKDACYGKAISHGTKKLKAEPSFGLYDAINKREACVRIIRKTEIVPDKFKLYKLGEFVVPESGYYHFGHWDTAMVANNLFDRDAMPGTKTKVYFSLKFEGPLYGSKALKNKIWCDRIIHIRGEN